MNAPENRPISFQFTHDGIAINPDPEIAYRVLSGNPDDPASWVTLAEGPESARDVASGVVTLQSAGLAMGVYEIFAAALGPFEAAPGAAISVVVVQRPVAPSVIQLVLQ